MKNKAGNGIEYTLHGDGRICKMSDNDRKNLKYIMERKRGWFTEIDVWPQIKRTYYSLNRLVDCGQLESDFDLKKDCLKYRLKKII
jgi:hypothetical protein